MTRDPSTGEVYELPKPDEETAATIALRRMRNILAGRDIDDDGPEAA